MVTEEGTAFGDPETRKGVEDLDLFRDFLATGKELGVGLGDSLGWWRSLGVFDGVFDKGLVVVRPVKVGAKLPNVAGHVVEPEVIRRKAFDGGRA